VSYHSGELKLAETFPSQFILKALEMCIWRVGLFEAGDGKGMRQGVGKGGWLRLV